MFLFVDSAIDEFGGKKYYRIELVFIKKKVYIISQLKHVFTTHIKSYGMNTDLRSISKHFTNFLFFTTFSTITENFQNNDLFCSLSL